MKKMLSLLLVFTLVLSMATRKTRKTNTIG